MNTTKESQAEQPIMHIKSGFAVFHGNGGYDAERSRAIKFFTVGEGYKVTGGQVGQSHTYINIEGIDGKWNSCLFFGDMLTWPIESLIKYKPQPIAQEDATKDPNVLPALPKDICPDCGEYDYECRCKVKLWTVCRPTPPEEKPAAWVPKFKVGQRVRHIKEKTFGEIVERLSGDYLVYFGLICNSVSCKESELEVVPSPLKWKAEREAFARGERIEKRWRHDAECCWASWRIIAEPEWFDYENVQYRIAPSPEPTPAPAQSAGEAARESYFSQHEETEDSFLWQEVAQAVLTWHTAHTEPRDFTKHPSAKSIAEKFSSFVGSDDPQYVADIQTDLEFEINKAIAAFYAEPRAVHHDETSEDYLKTWNEFWAAICMKDGAVDMDAVMRELHDFHYVMEEVPKVYCEITGGRLSKVNYPADTVLSVYREHVENLIQESKEDDTEPRAVEVPTVEVSIIMDRDGTAHSKITCGAGASFEEVLSGLIGARMEIEDQINNRNKCPMSGTKEGQVLHSDSLNNQLEKACHEATKKDRDGWKSRAESAEAALLTASSFHKSAEARIAELEREVADYKKNWEINNIACQQEAQGHAKTRESLRSLKDCHLGSCGVHWDRPCTCIADLRTQLTAVTQERDQLSDRRNETVAMCEQLQSELTAAEREKARLEKELKDELALSEQRGQAVMLLHREIKGLEKERDTALADVAALRQQVQGWIATSERMPTKADSDKNEEILWLHSHGHYLKYYAINWGEMPTHWLPIPPLPTPAPPEAKSVWTLPAPPEGREWCRMDWTEDMLPEGWRPLLKGEMIFGGKDNDELLLTAPGYRTEEWHWQYMNTSSFPTHKQHWRTRRPLPAKPDAERERFEAAFSGHYRFTRSKDSPDLYWHDEVQHAWGGWKSALAVKGDGV